MLLKTRAFKVWGSEEEAKLNKDLLSKDKRTGSVIVGGRKITLDDVIKVAVNGFQVILDPSTVVSFEEISSGLHRSAKFSLPSKKQNSSSVQLPRELCRAALFQCVASFMQLKSGVRYELVDFLVCILNSDVVPCFSSVVNAQYELVAMILGQNIDCYTNDGIMVASAALQSARINCMDTLYDYEGSTLLYGQFTLPGMGALVAAGAVRTFRAVDAISAYSCESVDASATPFDADRFDVMRPHRGQMTAAANMRLFLEASGNIQSSENPEALGCFSQIPQVNGAALEQVTTAARSLEIELNSTQQGPLSSSSQGLDSTQALMALSMITTASDAVTSAACERIAVLKGDCNDPLLQYTDVSRCGEPVLLAYDKIKRLAYMLGVEMYLASRKMSLATAVENIQNAASSQSGEDNSSQVNEEGKSSREPKEPSLEGLSEAQIARIEAKRKAKADKAAAKAKKKEAKKGPVSGGGGAVVSVQLSRLGGGTNQIKNEIVHRKLFQSIDSCVAAMRPFEPTLAPEESFSDYCEKVLAGLQSGSGGKRKAPKIPKGARDFLPDQMRIREQAFNAIRRVFKRHGAVEIDTPVFELKEVLTGKYGEDSKLIYDLADQGGELLSLRYDLTVPFARFLAMNTVGNIKRYHMAKVYRRDNPQITKGRYREFYQCDFDVAGSYRPMVADAEVLSVAAEILSDLPIGQFMIKLNHRKILDAVFEIAGVPEEKFRPICSAVDKLDKATWEEVKQEMTEEKGLDSAVADRIGEFVLFKGEPREMWNRLNDSKIFGDHKGAKEAMDEMALLFDYLEAMGTLCYISFDMSLARGLDYYTGVIYEAVLTDGVSQMGSIAAGGRYDNLVGMFSSSGQQTPCVGVSIGVERVFTIMERKALSTRATQQHSDVQVYVASVGAGYLVERMKVAKMLWQNNIPAEYSHLHNPKMVKQLDETLERYIPVMIVFGEDELQRKVVKVKNMNDREEVEVSRDEASIVEAVLKAGGKQAMAGADFGLIEAMRM